MLKSTVDKNKYSTPKIERGDDQMTTTMKVQMEAKR